MTAEIITLARYRRRRARQAEREAAATLKVDAIERQRLIDWLEERATQLIRGVEALPFDSERRMRVEKAACDWLDVASLMRGCDPRADEREFAARLKFDDARGGER